MSRALTSFTLGAPHTRCAVRSLEKELSVSPPLYSFSSPSSRPGRPEHAVGPLAGVPSCTAAAHVLDIPAIHTRAAIQKRKGAIAPFSLLLTAHILAQKEKSSATSTPMNTTTSQAQESEHNNRMRTRRTYARGDLTYGRLSGLTWLDNGCPVRYCSTMQIDLYC